MMCKDEALRCMNQYRNQLHIDGVIDLNNSDLDKKFEDTRDYVLDRYYNDNDTELDWYDRDKILKYLLFWCGIGEADTITSRAGNTYIGYRLNMAHPLLSEEERDLFLKAKKFYFPELFEDGSKEE